MVSTRSASLAPHASLDSAPGQDSAPGPSLQPSSAATSGARAELLSSLQEVLTTTLEPLTSRMEQLETHLSLHPPPTGTPTLFPSLSLPGSAIPQEENDTAASSRQLHQELEGGLPQSVFASVMGSTAAKDATILNANELKLISQWFSGVKPEYIRLILKHEFPPTDIVKLTHGLTGKSPRKDTPLVPRLSDVGKDGFGVLAFASPEPTEEEYSMFLFLQAWEVYRGIFIWGAPTPLRGPLASALSAHSLTVFRLSKVYSWVGARAYHFAFHQLRLDDPATIYQPESWRRVNPDLVHEHCFTNPANSIRSSYSFSSSPSRYLPRHFARFQPYHNNSLSYGPGLLPGANFNTRSNLPTPVQSAQPLSERIQFQPSSHAGPAGNQTTQLGTNMGQGMRKFPNLCDHYNARPNGCFRTNCKFLHACNVCGKVGHGAFECTSVQGVGK
ncbi:hypothetical protein BJ508DRAFT_314040 [Ascobolus immersus RN42]|uniref:Uncharacterized protein n=1 Tax=Ascobolus immersus RN42 TaxID=1160509 RepID=A0A3N4HGK0_ASCIM|nr:hypothetical protein BJ508DRAFT_314040 [Ascobolus immersus RN42]